MTPINQIVLLQWLMNESRKTTWVKNKKSGAVYQVVNFNPDVHSKPSQKEIEKTQKNYSNLSDFRSSEFGKSKEGIAISNAMSSFLDTGKITSENKKLLEKYIVTDGGEPAKWAVLDSSGKPTVRLPDGMFDHFIEITKSNESQGFVDQMKRVSKTQKNAGKAAEKAATDYLIAHSKSPSKLDESWKDNLENIGIDISKPFSVVQSGDNAVVGVNPITGEKSNGTSKADIVITQNGKSYRISVKYSGGSSASFGQWHTKNIAAYLKGPLKGKNTKEIDEFINALNRIRDGAYKGKTAVEDRTKDHKTAAEFLKSKIGTQFIYDVMSKTTQGCLLPEEARATHMMNINQKGGVDTYTVEEYLKILQDAGAGTFGCGAVLGSSSSAQGRQTVFRPGAVSDNINFKAVDWFKFFGEDGYNARKPK